jgi:hypothetical protein
VHRDRRRLGQAGIVRPTLTDLSRVSARPVTTRAGMCGAPRRQLEIRVRRAGTFRPAHC